MALPHHHEQHVPRGVLIAAAALLLVTIGIAAFAKASRGDEAPIAVSPDAASVELRFADREDGSVAVLSAETGDEVATVPPETGGFIRGVLRGMFRTRMLEDVSRDAPFLLIQEADGPLVLADPETDRHVELRGFGRTNFDAFSRLLQAGQYQQHQAALAAGGTP